MNNKGEIVEENNIIQEENNITQEEKKIDDIIASLNNDIFEVDKKHSKEMEELKNKYLEKGNINGEDTQSIAGKGVCKCIMWIVDRSSYYHCFNMLRNGINDYGKTIVENAKYVLEEQEKYFASKDLVKAIVKDVLIAEIPDIIKTIIEKDKNVLNIDEDKVEEYIKSTINIIKENL
jgi:type III secretory pathway component EscV